LLCELLETARTGQSQWWPIRGDRGAVAVIGLTALAMGCFSLLPVIDRGAPTVVATSTFDQDPDIAQLELYANSAPKYAGVKGAGSKAGGTSEPQELPDVETMIERLAARLQAAPEDAEGWRMLGWSYFNIRQASKAAEAYARALTLQPQSSEIQTAYGEALVAEAGTVTPTAIKVFNSALALDAGNGKARYFIALAMEQAGKKKEALDAWISLQAEPLGEEAWVGELRERTQTLARELKADLPARVALPAVGQAANTPVLMGSRQPTAEQIQRIKELPADEQQVLIHGMVSTLADRLQKQPRDEEGWLRLIRSRLVLGEDKAAREALSQALAVFSDNDPAGARIAAAAKELGITND
jgi:cytochrome c-type biogenesis protein CcmH